MTSAHDRSRVEQSATIGGLPVRTHDHVCVLYRGDDQRDELMADFLADGVRAGHRCYCMITPDNHRTDRRLRCPDAMTGSQRARHPKTRVGSTSSVPGEAMCPAESSCPTG